MDLANPGIMNQAAALTNVLPGVQQALLGDQQIQQNQNVLDQQARADKARQAESSLVADPKVDDAQFEELLRPIAQFDPARAAAMRRQRQMSRDFAAVAANPTAQGIGKLGMAYAGDFKELSAAWQGMDAAQRDASVKTNADVYGYLMSGFKPGATPEQAKAAQAGAIQILQAHMAAADKTGEDTSSYPQLIEMIRNNPSGAATMAGLSLSVGMGPDKFADTYGKLGEEARKADMHPAEVRKANALASQEQTKAQYAPQTIQSDLQTQQAQRQRWAAQSANEVADIALKRDGLALERDKLESSIQMKFEELDRTGTQLDSGARNAVNTAVAASVSASALADRATNLADRMRGQDMGWGWASTARDAWKGMYGGQDPITGLRSEYNQLVNAQAVKNLPPGPASDKDIALAKQGFPPSNASGAYLESFLRGMAKMQTAVAQAEDRKANWISSNGSLAPVRRDTNIAGVMVPAGTTFAEFNGNAVKRGKQGETPASLQGIISKYGSR